MSGHTTEDLSRIADEQWQREVDLHIPGFKVSDLPEVFVVNGMSINGEPRRRIFEPIHSLLDVPERWEHVGNVLRNLAQQDDGTWEIPDNWSYRELVERLGVTRAALDLRNPRHYSLDGAHIPGGASEGHYALQLKQAWKEWLGWLWHLDEHVLPPNPINLRRKRIFSFLDHHHTRGSNPESFRDFVHEVARNIHAMPPPPTMNNLLNEAQGGTRTPLRDADGLAALLKEWLATSTVVEPEWITFGELWGADNAQKVKETLVDVGIGYVPNKGKRRYLAGIHAACDHFGKHPRRLMDWPEMLANFVPGSTWGEKIAPWAQAEWDDAYRTSYHAVKDRLEQ